MKKLFLVAVLSVFAFSTVNAQDEGSSSGPTEQGNFVLSGAAGLQFISSNIEIEYDGESLGDYTVNTFSFMPSFGYFVMDNFAVGLSANFSTMTEKDDGNKYIVKSTMIIPSALYYFPVAGDVKPLVQVGAGYMSSTFEENYDGPGEVYKDKSSGLVINIGGGVSYFANDFVSINFGLSYTMANLKDSEDSESVTKQGNFGANIGLSVFL